MAEYSDMMQAPHFNEDLQKLLLEGRANEYMDVDVDLYGFLKGDYMDSVNELIEDACSAFGANDQKAVFEKFQRQIAAGEVPTVTVYRAVPDFVNEINDGDWITLSKDYAKTHGKNRFEDASDIDGWHILEKEVPVTKIWWDQGSPYELGYSEKELIREPQRDIDKSLSLEQDKDLSPEQKQDKDLSPEQREYFKNSVVRDDNGNLLEVYHGTTNQKVFDAFDPTRIGKTNGMGHGAGFNFTDNLDMAKHYATHQVSMNTIKPLLDMPYGHVYKCYLNITKPLSTDKRTLTREDMENAFFDAVYAIGSGYDYDAITEACKNSVENLMEGRSDAEIITILSEDALDFAMSDSDIWGDFEAKAGNDYIDDHYDEIIDEYGEEWDTADVLGWDFASNQARGLIRSTIQNSIGFDGFIGQMYGGGMVYVALSPEQIKATVNLTPSHDKSMFEGYEEIKSKDPLTELLVEISEDIKTLQANGQNKAAEHLMNAMMYAGVQEQSGRFMIEDPKGNYVNAEEYKYASNCIESLKAAKDIADKMLAEEPSKEQPKEQVKEQTKVQKRDLGMDR